MAAPPLPPSDAMPQRSRWYRYQVALMLFVAYSVFYVCRRSLSASTYHMLHADVQRFGEEVSSILFAPMPRVCSSLIGSAKSRDYFAFVAAFGTLMPPPLTS